MMCGKKLKEAHHDTEQEIKEQRQTEILGIPHQKVAQEQVTLYTN